MAPEHVSQHTPIAVSGQHAGKALADAPATARSLYIHIPFCSHKCHYCDFYSIVDTRDRQQAFTTRMIAELRALAPFAAPLETIFIGGGTPSLLRLDLWDLLLTALADAFDLSPILRADGEFTVECNPESATPDLLALLRSRGVNRVSLGAQSFHTAHLKTLERLHNPASIPRALELAAAAGIRRRSIDLIFAIPGQTLDEWTDDLDTALALGTEHISCYNLTYEPNTAMTARLHRGEFTPIDEDLEAAMFEATLDRIRARGLDRYEVSNFARPGEACRHNLAYWRQDEWLAAGPSASAHIAGHRWKNTPRLDDYLAGNHAGFPPIVDHERPDPRRALRERIMTGVRLAEGLPREETLLAAAALDAAAHDQLQRAVDRQRRWGALAESSGRWTLTDAGFLIADAVARDLMSAIA